MKVSAKNAAVWLSGTVDAAAAPGASLRMFFPTPLSRELSLFTCCTS